MKLYACGFNAHNQLDFSGENAENPQDIETFKLVYDEKAIRIKVRCALFCSTVIDVGDELLLAGYPFMRRGLNTIQGLQGNKVRTIFGDHKGVQGALGNNGQFYEFRSTTYEGHKFYPKNLVDHENHCLYTEGIARKKDVPYQIAIAGNGKACVVLAVNQIFNESDKTRLEEIPSMRTFFSPYCERTRDSSDLPDLIEQLVANETTFAALAEIKGITRAQGQVFSWGDRRHALIDESYGKVDEDVEPYGSRVDALDGIKIKKIAAGGYITAALSTENDLYLWGGRVGEANCISDLQGSDEDDEPVKVANVDGQKDIKDVAVGSGHIVVLTKDGKVYAAGTGHNGQLGMGEGKRDFVRDWTEVKGLEGKTVTAVHCGPWNSFAIVAD